MKVLSAIRWTYRIPLPVIAAATLIVLPEFRVHPVYVMGSWLSDVAIRALITLMLVKGFRAFASIPAFHKPNRDDLSMRLSYDVTIRWGVKGYTVIYIINAIGYCTITSVIAGWSIAAFLPFLGDYIFIFAMIVALLLVLGCWLAFPIGRDWAKAVNNAQKMNMTDARLVENDRG